MKKTVIMGTLSILSFCGCNKPKYKACFSTEKEQYAIGETVKFENCSDFNGGLDGCLWVFGDGNQKNTFGNESVEHTYQEKGIYTVKLWIGLKEGPADEIKKTIKVE